MGGKEVVLRNGQAAIFCEWKTKELVFYLHCTDISISRII